MERGFIQGKLEIKLLLLYILCRVEAPVTLDTLADVAMCDSGVSYFDLSTALAELTESDHVALSGGTYTATDKGRRNGAITEDNIPYSVRMRCDHRLADINQALRQAQRVHAAVISKGGEGFQLTLALDGEDGPVFTMTLLCDAQEDADRLADRFRQNPEAFVQTLRTIE